MNLFPPNVPLYHDMNTISMRVRESVASIIWQCTGIPNLWLDGSDSSQEDTTAAPADWTPSVWLCDIYASWLLPCCYAITCLEPL